MWKAKVNERKRPRTPDSQEQMWESKWWLGLFFFTPLIAKCFEKDAINVGEWVLRGADNEHETTARRPQTHSIFCRLLLSPAPNIVGSFTSPLLGLNLQNGWKSVRAQQKEVKDR